MKYKLLKDLPWAKAGTEKEAHNDGDIYFKDEEGLASVLVNPRKYPEWLEPVIERWKPEPEEKYFYFYNQEEIGICSFNNDPLDKERFKLGNCFQTKEQAEKASELVHKTLMEYHKSLNQ